MSSVGQGFAEHWKFSREWGKREKQYELNHKTVLRDIKILGVKMQPAYEWEG